MRVTELKKLCGTVTNVVRGTSEFYLIYLTLHYVVRFVESNTLDLPRYLCDQTLEPRRALVFYIQAVVIIEKFDVWK